MLIEKLESVRRKITFTFRKTSHDFTKVIVFFSIGLPLEDAADVVKKCMDNLVTQNTYPRVFLFACMEYITQNLLQHYHLFLFGLCYNRQPEIHTHDVLVETSPCHLITLNEGKQVDQWTMEEDLKILENDFKQKEKVTIS